MRLSGSLLLCILVSLPTHAFASQPGTIEIAPMVGAIGTAPMIQVSGGVFVTETGGAELGFAHNPGELAESLIFSGALFWQLTPQAGIGLRFFAGGGVVRTIPASSVKAPAVSNPMAIQGLRLQWFLSETVALNLGGRLNVVFVGREVLSFPQIGLGVSLQL